MNAVQNNRPISPGKNEYENFAPETFEEEDPPNLRLQEMRVLHSKRWSSYSKDQQQKKLSNQNSKRLLSTFLIEQFCSIIIRKNLAHKVTVSKLEQLNSRLFEDLNIKNLKLVDMEAEVAFAHDRADTAERKVEILEAVIKSFEAQISASTETILSEAREAIMKAEQKVKEAENRALELEKLIFMSSTGHPPKPITVTRHHLVTNRVCNFYLPNPIDGQVVASDAEVDHLIGTFESHNSFLGEVSVEVNPGVLLNQSQGPFVCNRAENVELEAESGRIVKLNSPVMSEKMNRLVELSSLRSSIVHSSSSLTLCEESDCHNAVSTFADYTEVLNSFFSRMKHLVDLINGQSCAVSDQLFNEATLSLQSLDEFNVSYKSLCKQLAEKNVQLDELRNHSNKREEELRRRMGDYMEDRQILSAHTRILSAVLEQAKGVDADLRKELQDSVLLPRLSTWSVVEEFTTE